MTVARDVSDDEPLIAAQQLLVLDAELFVGSALGILEPDIGQLDELQENLTPLRVAEVERYAEDVPALLDPVGGNLSAVFRRQPESKDSPIVAGSRSLYQDHLRAHLSSELRGKGSG